jgi:ribonuclease HI
MTNKTLKEVKIYTDGSCSKNPGGLSGWGAILIYVGGGGREYRKEIYGGFRSSTNNRMELMAILQAISLSKEPCKVFIHTDSQYVTKAFNLGWIINWQTKNWKDVKNVDLWKQILVLCSPHQIEWLWIKGHNGHPEQERSDYLANLGVKSKEIAIDFAYEQFVIQENQAKDQVKDQKQKDQDLVSSLVC